MEKKKIDKMVIVNKIAWTILILLGIYVVIFGIRSMNTTSYCKTLDYDYYERVGKEHFNCCRDTIQNVLQSDSFRYELKTKCIAGGIYPAR